jgi:hypothetical protein
MHKRDHGAFDAFHYLPRSEMAYLRVEQAAVEVRERSLHTAAKGNCGN